MQSERYQVMKEGGRIPRGCENNGNQNKSSPGCESSSFLRRDKLCPMNLSASSCPLCRVTNNPQIRWLRPSTLIMVPQSMGQLGHLSGLGWAPSRAFGQL